MPSGRESRRASESPEGSSPSGGVVAPRAPEPTPAAGISGPGNFADFIYRGGPVINTPKVHILFVGDWTSTANQDRATRLTQFVTDLLTSRYMNIASQYGCGSSGTVASTSFIASTNNNLSGTDIHNIIQAAINNNTIPEPTDAATCVLIYLDDATAVNDGSIRICEPTSDNAFGYHTHFVTTAGNVYPFGVVPGLNDTCLKNSCASDSGCSLHLAQTQEQRQTQVVSHELIEMFSNPQVSTNEAWSRPGTGDPHENGDICNAQSATITVGANTWTVQKMYSKWHDMTTAGATTCITDTGPLPSLLPACTVVLDRSTFGKDEVDALLHVSTPGLIDAAFYVAADGFTPNDLGITAASLAGTPNVAPTITLTPAVAGMSVSPTSLVAEDPSLAGAIQRFTWVYRVSFSDSTGFPAATGDVTQVALSAAISRKTAPVVSASGTAIMQLIHEPNPYEIDGPVSWLSTDLRVFQLPAGGSKFNANMGSGPADAPTFIQQVIGNLNSGNTGGQTFDIDLSTDENATQLELSEKVNGTPIFNFAVAKVRYRSLSADVAGVRVFFRLFPVSTTGTAYDQGTTYRRGAQAGSVIPLLGISGGEATTIPCFASPRIDTSTQSMNAQTDAPNVQTISHNASGQETSAYFGAWLDINQPSQPQFPLAPSPVDGPYAGGDRQTIQQLVRGAHQCLVSEIAFDPDPIPTGATPGSSDKLAQRNLAIVASANPGDPASRSIPHPFDLHRTVQSVEGGPDELLIDCRTLPSNSNATLYLPGESAAAIKEAADEKYVSHHLSLVDAHTLTFPARNITYVPIPEGSGASLPALLTVNLPAGVRQGQAFKVIVRQVTDAAGTLGPPVIESGTGGGAAAQARGDSITKWRQVTGTYQVSIPVHTEDVLLQPEERLLAVLRWILLSVPPTNRWYLVFRRYVDQVADRVRGLGGDPDAIEPSPSGEGRDREEESRCVTGKVCEVRFDCFGDFEGFVLDGCDRRHFFKSHEAGIGKLVMQACQERLTICVCIDDRRSRVERIIVRC